MDFEEAAHGWHRHVQWRFSELRASRQISSNGRHRMLQCAVGICECQVDVHGTRERIRLSTVQSKSERLGGYYSQLFLHSELFLATPRCYSQLYLVIPNYSEPFLAIPKYPQLYLTIPSYP